VYKRSIRAIVIVASVLAGVGITAACSDTIDMGVVKGPPATPSPGFTNPNSLDGAVPLEASSGSVGLCMGTECPDPWTTCVSEDGPTYKCGTDLKRDNNNCGSCGNKCLTYKPTHMTSRCIDGACELECFSEPNPFDQVDWRNCNGLVDDGCETNVLADAKHCGVCGNACAAGTPCIDGKCGCPKGKIVCFGMCVDPLTDDNHCGGCGNLCEPPADACDPMPDRTRYGCRAGKCGALKCLEPAADCNADLGASKCGGDGCEVESLGTKDNCGGCGIKCKDDEECVDEGNGRVCAIPCAKAGKTLCPGPQCIDLLNDPNSCGACNSPCKPAGPNQQRACKKGVCFYECLPGWADCNGDTSDGCETNLNVHPGNCGACGNACNIGAGQPCIEGKCLTIDCDGGVTK
jgi:hypothetical protein